VTETDTNETKREQLRRKVAESQAALTKPQTAAGEPPEGYRALAADYPFALLLGGDTIEGVLRGMGEEALDVMAH